MTDIVDMINGYAVEYPELLKAVAEIERLREVIARRDAESAQLHDEALTRNLTIDNLVFTRDQMRKSHNEIEQILGKALGFPPYPDDWPEAEAHVCVGDHIPESLATMIVGRLAAAERFRSDWYERLAAAERFRSDWYERDLPAMQRLALVLAPGSDNEPLPNLDALVNTAIARLAAAEEVCAWFDADSEIGTHRQRTQDRYRADFDRWREVAGR